MGTLLDEATRAFREYNLKQQRANESSNDTAFTIEEASMNNVYFILASDLEKRIDEGIFSKLNTEYYSGDNIF